MVSSQQVGAMMLLNQLGARLSYNVGQDQVAQGAAGTYFSKRGPVAVRLSDRARRSADR
jgi:hypothetical protein